MTLDIGYSVQQPGLWYSHPGSGFCPKEELGTVLPLGRRLQNPCAVTVHVCQTLAAITSSRRDIAPSLWGPSTAFRSSANQRFPGCQAGLTGIIKKHDIQQR